MTKVLQLEKISANFIRATVYKINEVTRADNTKLVYRETVDHLQDDAQCVEYLISEILERNQDVVAYLVSTDKDFSSSIWHVRIDNLTLDYGDALTVFDLAQMYFEHRSE